MNHWSRWLTLPVSLAAALPVAAEGLSMVSYPPASRTLKIGDSIEVALKIKYFDVKPGTIIYVILSPLDGDSVILEEDNKIKADKPSLSFCGKFVNKDASPFSIAPANRPITTSFNYAELLKLLEGKYPKEQLDAFRKSTKAETLRLTFGFVATTQRAEGLVDGSIKFRVPNLPHYYDGILITPYFFSFNKKGSLCARYDGHAMHSIKYPVAPNRTRKEPKARQAATAPKGSVKILSFEPKGKELVIGRSNSIRLKVRYTDLAPNSEIYAFLSPVRGNRLVSGKRTMSLRGLAFTTCKSEKSESKLFAIPDRNRPITVDVPLVGQMEAAHVVTLAQGGNGVASGTLAFSPPALGTFYDAVRLTAVVYQWSASGKFCTRLDGARASSIVLPLLGR